MSGQILNCGRLVLWPTTELCIELFANEPPPNLFYNTNSNTITSARKLTNFSGEFYLSFFSSLSCKIIFHRRRT